MRKLLASEIEAQDNVRLRELRAARLIVAGEAGYALTRLGQQLLSELATLNKWAGVWARQV